MNRNINEKTRHIIEQKSTDISGEISAKLNQSRHKALSQVSKKSQLFKTWYIPVAALTVMAVYILMPLININSINTDLQDDYALIVNDEIDIEMLEQLEVVEDLEFYQWLNSEEENPTSSQI